MFIYVVKSGDSVFSIANKYRIPMNSVRIINGLQTDQLVPGQDLLIPSTVYIVQPGDSLYKIAQMALVPIETIRLFNGLHTDVLMIGMSLYLPPRKKDLVETFSYLVPSTPEKNRVNVQTFASLNSYFGVFEYHILEDGNLSSLNDQNLVTLIRANGVAPIAVITNLTASGFSSELTKRILNNPILRQKVIDNIYNLVKSKKYAGVNIDFERVRESERDLYSGFLHAIRNRLRPEGFSTSAAVPAKTDDQIPWLKGYDYGGIGAAVDFVFIMAYDWHEASSPPGPVAPIIEVRKTIEYALRFMGRNKIILGVARYGYDWTMSNGKVVSARAHSISDSINIAMRYRVPIQYSIQYQQPYFSYRDETGNYHIVWFEDIKARAKKYQLVFDYQLRGVGAWQLALQFPQSDNLINEYFRKKTVI
ncbi:glycosyl hydrolase family 18 protein [Lederbergia citrea]|uniref:glycosyl hydrolase family 18 protein n=1 Tax=Lederbergia citrea TaxID=2833581 RepID=UPI001BC945B8|nr:glycosyl hydrolase family 18 protein [Lederbergia citrea]MBS4205646.1 glycoside hydrolase family 18 protein [Lederbergia citrea]